MGLAIKGMVWTTQYGEVLNVENMETPHIYNCIALMEKRGQIGCPMWFYMKGILVGRKQQLSKKERF